jgi:hypothetical protein
MRQAIEGRITLQVGFWNINYIRGFRKGMGHDDNSEEA